MTAERCPRCDKPLARDEDYRREEKPGDEALCWEPERCKAIDWRARALTAEAERDAERAERKGVIDEALVARAQRMEAERDQVIAALHGLREAARAYVSEMSPAVQRRKWVPLCDAIAATPADLGARVIAEARAKALGEAADYYAAGYRDPICRHVSAWLRERAAMERSR